MRQKLPILYTGPAPSQFNTTDSYSDNVLPAGITPVDSPSETASNGYQTQGHLSEHATAEFD